MNDLGFETYVITLNVYTMMLEINKMDEFVLYILALSPKSFRSEL